MSRVASFIQAMGKKGRGACQSTAILKNWVTGQDDRLIFGFGYKLMNVEVVAHRGANSIVEGEPGIPATSETGD